MVTLLLSIPVVLLLSLFAALRSRSSTSLNWPRKMGFGGFKSRIRSTLKQQGWVFHEPQKPPFPMMAKKGGAKIILIGLHTNDGLTATKATDLDSFRTESGVKQMVCIFAEEIHKDFEYAARQKNFYVMHYKQLGSFAQIPSPTAKALADYFNPTKQP